MSSYSGMSSPRYLNESTYLRHLASKNEAKQWECLSYMAEYHWSNTRNYNPDYFTFADITSSGDVREWQQDMKKDIPTTRGNLKSSQANITQLILFDQRNRLSAQELFGDLYDIDPGFFRDVAYSQMATEKYPFETDNSEPPLEHPFREYHTGYSPEHLNFGYGWVGKVIHRKETSDQSPSNVVIISIGSTELSRRLDFGFAHENHLLDDNPFYTRYYYTKGLGIGLKRSTIHFRNVYLRNIHHRGNPFYREAHDNPLLFMLPILEIHAAYLQNEFIHADGCLRLGRTRHGKQSDLVERAWDSLRMLKYDGMGPLRCFQHYVKDHGVKDHSIEDHSDQVPQPPIGFEKAFKKLESINAQIIRAEELARDYIQINVGCLSLEESRASIKQSKVALEESKRTKLITVLAIFFVPISLSTSIFGMNIGELNANGQPLWVFIVTTALIVAATMVSWAFMYQLQKCNSLPDCPQPPLGGRRFSHRISLLLKLMCHGHILWIWKSGIVFSLLTSGRKGFVMSCLGHPVSIEYAHDPHAPERYIWAHLGGERGFECSKLVVT